MKQPACSAIFHHVLHEQPYHQDDGPWVNFMPPHENELEACTVMQTLMAESRVSTGIDSTRRYAGVAVATGGGSERDEETPRNT